MNAGAEGRKGRGYRTLQSDAPKHNRPVCEPSQSSKVVNRDWMACLGNGMATTQRLCSLPGAVLEEGMAVCRREERMLYLGAALLFPGCVESTGRGSSESTHSPIKLIALSAMSPG